MRLFDIFRKKKTLKQAEDLTEVGNNSESENHNNNIEIQQYNVNPLVEVATFDGFGFWIESVHTIKRIFAIMKPAVNAIKDNGYTVKAVSADGGVQEFDTGYIPFSEATYSSFEEAEEKLPNDFSEEKAKQSGSLLSEVNFEYFSIVFTKNNNDSMLVFSRGELRVSAEIAELIPVSEMKAVKYSI